MSYTKQTWATGDTVTASKLNHMEDGIAGAGGGIVLDLVDKSTPLTMTFEEIADAIGSGTNVYIKYDTHEDWGEDYVTQVALGRVTRAYKYDINYRIAVDFGGPSGNLNTATDINTPATLVLSATSPSAYPVFYKHIFVKYDASVIVVDDQIG